MAYYDKILDMAEKSANLGYLTAASHHVEKIRILESRLHIDLSDRIRKIEELIRIRN